VPRRLRACYPPSAPHKSKRHLTTPNYFARAARASSSAVGGPQMLASSSLLSHRLRGGHWPPTSPGFEPREQLFKLHVKNFRLLMYLDHKLLRLVRLFFRSRVPFENRPRTARCLIDTRRPHLRRMFNTLAIAKPNRTCAHAAHSSRPKHEFSIGRKRGHQSTSPHPTHTSNQRLVPNQR